MECPRTLVDQWVQEATEKFGLKEEVDVVSIKTTRDLGSKTVAQLSEAKMIIISSGVLGSSHMSSVSQHSQDCLHRQQ